MTTAIASFVQICLQEFDQIITSQELEKFQSEVLPGLWLDELGRLRVWTADIGAHQTGQASLDYRLRDASHLKAQTLRVLGRLRRTIQDLESLLRRTYLQEGSLSDSNDDEDESSTEIQKIYYSLRDTISNLFINSVSIQSPAHHDIILGIKRSDAASFEPYDRQHVENKFPLLDATIQYRLGLAISQRRATLQYRERRHLKLAQRMNQITKVNDMEDKKSMMLSETFATEIVPIELQSTFSQTSYANTVMKGGKGMNILPPPPRGSLKGDPFECPYCFLILKNVDDRRSWVKHVFHDLMPYICVFPNCKTPHRLFGSRHEWYNHLKFQHEIPDDLDILMDCPLCRLPLNCGKPLERHLGQHLQELALFALPLPDSNEISESYTSGMLKKNATRGKAYSEAMPKTRETTRKIFKVPDLKNPVLSEPSHRNPKEPLHVRDMQYDNKLSIENLESHVHYCRACTSALEKEANSLCEPGYTLAVHAMKYPYSKDGSHSSILNKVSRILMPVELHREPNSVETLLNPGLLQHRPQLRDKQVRRNFKKRSHCVRCGHLFNGCLRCQNRKLSGKWCHVCPDIISSQTITPLPQALQRTHPGKTEFDKDNSCDTKQIHDNYKYTTALKEMGDAESCSPYYDITLINRHPIRWGAVVEYKGFRSFAAAHSKRAAKHSASRRLWLEMTGESIN